MQSHNFKKLEYKKVHRRVGRGGKRGTYSGRGIKGQKSRAGANIRPQIWDYILATPKHTGTTKKASGYMGKGKIPPYSLNIGELEKIVQKGDIVDIKFLSENNLIKNRKTRAPKYVKLLGKGKLSKAITVKGFILSKGARIIVEAAGGKIID